MLRNERCIIPVSIRAPAGSDAHLNHLNTPQYRFHPRPQAEGDVRSCPRVFCLLGVSIRAAPPGAVSLFRVHI